MDIKVDLTKKNKMVDEDESGYLFRDGKVIDFEKIMLNHLAFGWKTGALRIRTTPNELDVDFITEIKPTKEQLDTIKKLKTNERKLFFEIVDKKNKHIKGYGGFDKTLAEMEKQLSEFYNKD